MHAVGVGSSEDGLLEWSHDDGVIMRTNGAIRVPTVQVRTLRKEGRKAGRLRSAKSDLGVHGVRQVRSGRARRATF